jgi:hypothetical protein
MIARPNAEIHLPRKVVPINLIVLVEGGLENGENPVEAAGGRGVR